MRRKQLHIVVASVLAALFATFNIGLPFVLYMCPMMANERCTCACTPSTTDGPALTYVHSACCNNNVLAERNTVPFLGALKYEPPHSEVVFVLASNTLWAMQPHNGSILSVSDVGPAPLNIPLYLLSSSLLI